MIILLFTQFAFILIGLGFVWIASTKRTQLHPYHSNCDSVHVFKRKSWYTPSGYKLHLSGNLLITSGFLIGSFYFILK